MRALWQLADPESIPALLTALRDPFPDVRQLAAAVLAKIRHPDAQRAVAALVDDHDEVVRRVVHKAMAGRRNRA